MIARVFLVPVDGFNTIALINVDEFIVISNYYGFADH